MFEDVGRTIGALYNTGFHYKIEYLNEKIFAGHLCNKIIKNLAQILIM